MMRIILLHIRSPSLSLSLVVLFCVLSHVLGMSTATNTTRESHPPCCTLPCENGGFCEEPDSGWLCNCAGTGHHGERCHVAGWRHWLRKLLLSCAAYPSRWRIVDLLLAAAAAFVEVLFPARAPAPAWPELYFDDDGGGGLRARLLPPVPDGCPTPLGVQGPQWLPSEEEVFESVLARRPGSFVPDHTGANLLLVAFAHHFLFQFQEAVPGAPLGTLQVDARQVYGCTEDASRLLRTGTGGRLRSRFVNKEEFPPCLEDAPVNMLYPANTGRARRLPYFPLTGSSQEREPRWALGHPMLAVTPLVFGMAVLWLREHNRVAGLLQADHPDWTDTQLYDKARAVVTGEMVSILLQELLPRLAGTSYTSLPHLPLPFTPLPLPAEFALTHFWGWQLPDTLEIAGELHNLTDLMFSNHRVVLEHGLGELCSALARQPSGRAGARSSGRLVKGWTKRVLREARAARTPPFNKYRELLGLPVVRSFLELVGEPRVARELKRLYSDPEAIELLTGILLERPLPGSVLPPTLLALSAPYLRIAASSSWLGPPPLWEPSTFGGEKGWQIVKGASIQNLVCNNLLSTDCSLSWDVPQQLSTQFFSFSNLCFIQSNRVNVSLMLTCAMEELRFALKATIIA